ncbi:MAG TPA: winged helix DNA-binding domain-containing protein [Acidimicrobiales bacterium]|nr:winged helix DNA-binding domain-containing protein [Acidimicrobiales bacterium]
MKVTWDQALAWRVGAQLLLEPSGTAMDVARRVAGVQAQVMSSAELAVGIRTGRPPEDVRAALWEDRALVKTWAMRGTLHLLPADELPTWVAALRAKEQAARRGQAWERYHGVTVAQLAEITAAVGEVLGSEPLTREQLGAAVASATADPRLGDVVRTGFGGTILKTAAANGDLCFGPDRGRNVTFVDPRTWVRGPWQEPEAAEAMAVVVHRFLDAYGPATTDDFARWWGVVPADGKRAVRPLAGELVEVDLDGSPGWLTPSGAEVVASFRPLHGHVRLVPAFDTYVLSPHSHRRYAWPEGFHDRISRKAGWISPALLVDGRVAGVWAHERRGDAVAVDIEAFTPLSKRVRAAAEAHARSYEPLVDAPVTVAWVSGSG